MLKIDTAQKIPVLRPGRDPRALPEDADDAERRLLERIDGRSSIAELAQVVNLPRATLCEAALALERREIIDLRTPSEDGAEGGGSPPIRYLADVRSHPLDGSSRRFDFAKLLMRVHLERLTGILRVVRPKTDEQPDEAFKNLYFLSGRLIDVRSHPFRPEECLGRILQQANRIEKQHVIDSLKAVRTRGVRQGRALVEAGIVSEEELATALETQVQVKLGEAFTWESWEHRFAPKPGFSDKIARIDTHFGYVLFNILWRVVPDREIRDAIDPLQPTLATRAPGAPFDVSEFRFERHMGRFWNESLARDILVERLLITATLDRDKTYKALFGLYQLGMVEFHGNRRETAATQTSERLREELLALRQRTHFDILGVHWTAGNVKVREAYANRIAQYRRDRDSGAENLRSLYDEFIELTETAFRTIETRELRHAYRRRIFDDRFLQSNADVFRRRAESLLFGKDDYPAAITELKGAIEVFEDEADYHALLALAIFKLFFPGRPDRYKESRERIERARHLRPDSDVVCMCEGMIAAIEHRVEEARTALGRALRINPQNALAQIEIEALRREVSETEREAAIGRYLSRAAAERPGGEL